MHSMFLVSFWQAHPTLYLIYFVPLLSEIQPSTHLLSLCPGKLDGTESAKKHSSPSLGGSNADFRWYQSPFETSFH